MGIGKIDLVSADSIANQILTHIRPALDRGEIAGSVRRRKEIVGDIEIVAISTQRDKLLALLSDVGQHIKPGVPGAVPWSPKPDAKYLRVRLNEGMNLDLFMASPENWGGLYLMRTGSGIGPDGNSFNGFTPGIFARWKKLSGGGRMTDCMPTMPTGEQLWIPEEQDFFDLLEMDFVPPQDRVSRFVIKNFSQKKNP
jgi:DNA polymerase/3'-5' exonuclease PolX